MTAFQIRRQFWLCDRNYQKFYKSRIVQQSGFFVGIIRPLERFTFRLDHGAHVSILYFVVLSQTVQVDPIWL